VTKEREEVEVMSNGSKSKWGVIEGKERDSSQSGKGKCSRLDKEW
jgi:hypothetical protein